MPGPINFTKAAIDGLSLPAPGKRDVWHDTKAPHLCLRVTSSGTKTFTWYGKIEGRPERVTIGPYPGMTIDQARRKAADISGQVANGGNPQQERRQVMAEPTFGEAFAWYIEHYAKPRKLTWDEDQARYNNHLQRFANRKAAKITKADMRELQTELMNKAGPYAANRTLVMLRCMFNRVRQAEVVTMAGNPAEGLELFPEKSRDRRLTKDERERFLGATVQEPNRVVRDFVLLSLFTGARRANVETMRWDQIDWTVPVWRIPRTKNGEVQYVPLHPLAVMLLERRRATATSPWVLPGPGAAGHLAEPRKGFERICERAGITDLRIHDLRREHGSLMADAGESVLIIGKALGHKSQKSTMVYAHPELDTIVQAQAKGLAAIAEIMDRLDGEW